MSPISGCPWMYFVLSSVIVVSLSAGHQPYGLWDGWLGEWECWLLWAGPACPRNMISDLSSWFWPLGGFPSCIVLYLSAVFEKGLYFFYSNLVLLFQLVGILLYCASEFCWRFPVRLVSYLPYFSFTCSGFLSKPQNFFIESLHPQLRVSFWAFCCLKLSNRTVFRFGHILPCVTATRAEFFPFQV